MTDGIKPAVKTEIKCITLEIPSSLPRRSYTDITVWILLTGIV